MVTNDYDLFFQPENVFLVVGASNNKEKYGAKVFLDLHAAGYNVVVINKNAVPGAEILGTPAYPSVTAFLDRVTRLFDEERRRATIARAVLVLVVPPASALAVVREAAGLGVTKVWFQLGAESDDAIAFCQARNITEMHGQCVMNERPAHPI